MIQLLALACPVCFGQSDSPMASAANTGILVMLAITAAVLAAFASFFIQLVRRARAAADESGPPHGGRGAHGAPARERSGAWGSPRATEPGSGAEPRFGQEGTAQC